MKNFEDVIIPESPRVLSKEQVSLQVPVASGVTPGLASFYSEHFVVIDGHVRLKDGYLKKVTDKPIKDLELNAYTDSRGCVLQLLSNGKLLNEAILDVDVSLLPITVATESEMTSLLTTAEVGSVVKYIGESTDTYESGALYIVEAVSE